MPAEDVRQLASSLGSSETELRQSVHGEHCKSARWCHDTDRPLRRLRQAQPDSWEGWRHAHVPASILAVDQRTLQVQRRFHSASTNKYRDPEDQLTSSASSPQAPAATAGGALATVGVAISSATETADWGLVSAMVGAIDALHSVTGLPWWATFAGTALGECHSPALCSMPSVSQPNIRLHTAHVSVNRPAQYTRAAGRSSSPECASPPM